MPLKVDFAPLVKRLQRYKGELGKPLLKEMESQARTFVSDPRNNTGMMQNTPPMNANMRGPAARQHGETLVKGEIYRVYGTPGKLFSIIKSKNINAARGFWKAVERSDWTTANAIARRIAGLEFKAFDDGAAHSAARNRRGRVPEKRQPTFFVSEPRYIAAYIKQKQSNVGLLAASFLHAGMELNARSIPAWVARQSHQISGSMRRVTGPGSFYLELHGTALFASDDQERRALYAVSYRLAALKRRMPYVLRAVHKQLGMAG